MGQGGVGKTSLVKRLVDNDFDPDEPRTDGIFIRGWQVTNREHTAEKERIRLNIWDFGGQEIMHATHQFFLTKRSLYLLVLDARKGEQEGNLYYWLSLIAGLGGDSPVIVVTNQCDDGNDLTLNESRHKLDYPNIAAFIKTSCKTGLGMDALRQRIEREVNDLPNAKELWPGSYFAIKQELERRAKTTHRVPIEDYREICGKHGERELATQDNVLRFLHDLGVVLYYDDPELAYDSRLRDHMILDPAWITQGVYRVVTSEALLKTRGVLDPADLPGLVNAGETPPRYDEKGCGYILDMMKKFELAFEFQAGKAKRFLVPERLDEMEPPLDWERPDALRFQVAYSVLPGGVIPRLITRTATLQRPDSPRWRSGMVLDVEGCEVFIRGDRERKRIFVHVHGDGETRRRALSVVRHELREINATLPGIETDELVPLPDEPEVTVAYEYLLALERDGDDDFRPQGAKKRYRVADLLGAVGRVEERERGPDHERLLELVDKRIAPHLDDMRAMTGALSETQKRLEEQRSASRKRTASSAAGEAAISLEELQARLRGLGEPFKNSCAAIVYGRWHIKDFFECEWREQLEFLRNISPVDGLPYDPAGLPDPTPRKGESKEKGWKRAADTLRTHWERLGLKKSDRIPARPADNSWFQGTRDDLA